MPSLSEMNQALQLPDIVGPISQALQYQSEQQQEQQRLQLKQQKDEEGQKMERIKNLAKGLRDNYEYLRSRPGKSPEENTRAAQAYANALFENETLAKVLDVGGYPKEAFVIPELSAEDQEEVKLQKNQAAVEEETRKAGAAVLARRSPAGEALFAQKREDTKATLGDEIQSREIGKEIARKSTPAYMQMPDGTFVQKKTGEIEELNLTPYTEDQKNREDTYRAIKFQADAEFSQNPSGFAAKMKEAGIGLSTGVGGTVDRMGDPKTKYPTMILNYLSNPDPEIQAKRNQEMEMAYSYLMKQPATVSRRDSDTGRMIQEKVPVESIPERLKKADRGSPSPFYYMLAIPNVADLTVRDGEGFWDFLRRGGHKMLEEAQAIFD